MVYCLTIILSKHQDTKSVSWVRWSKTELLKIEIFTNASILILCLYVFWVDEFRL